MAVVTHYDTLKISRTAPTDVIRAAYRALAQKYHPDRNLDNPEAVLMMQLINIAYNTLTDEKKRADHDGWIATQAPKKPPPPPLSPEQQAKRDKNIKEITAWEAFAAKEAKEAEAVRAKAAKAAQQAADAPAHEKAKWDAYAKQAAEEAKAAEAKAAKAAQQAGEKITALGGIAAPVVEKKIITQYDVLFVARDAPIDVIKAAHKVLAIKYQPGEGGASAEALEMLQRLNEAYKILSDAGKRAEHDNWIAAQEPQEKTNAPANAPARKTTTREAEFQAQAEKLLKEANAFKAWSEQAETQAKEAEAKAAKSSKDAQAHAKDKDADKWAAFAAKEAAAAREARQRAVTAAEKAATARQLADQAAQQVALVRQQAEREAAEKAAEEEKTRALWEKHK